MRSLLDRLAALAVIVGAAMATRRPRSDVHPNDSRPPDDGPAPGAVGFARTVLANFGRHKAGRIAAALAYYTLFSLAPLLLLAFAIAGLVVDESAARQTLLEQLETVASPGIAETVVELLEARSRGGGSGVFSNVVSGALLFIGASGLFLQLRSALNTVWEIPEQEVSGIVNAVWARVLGLGAIFLLGGGLLLLTLGSSAVAFFADEIADAVPRAAGAIQVLNPIVAVVGVAAIVGVMLRMLPAAGLRWRLALIGGLITTVVIAAGAAAVGVLFAFTDPGANFGDFAPIIVLLVFIYYVAQSFLLGAEITAEWDRRTR